MVRSVEGSPEGMDDGGLVTSASQTGSAVVKQRDPSGSEARRSARREAATSEGSMNQFGQAPVPSPSAVSIPGRPAPRPSLAAWWRQPTAVALIIVACLMAPAALAAAYVHTVIMDVDGYVDAVTPIADDPAVQKAVADVAGSKQVSGALDADLALPDGAPGRTGRLHRVDGRPTGRPDRRPDPAGRVQPRVPRLLGERQPPGASRPHRHHQEQGPAHGGTI